MEYLSWTAVAVEFSGAGVYVGFAASDEHELVINRLSRKQLRVFTGGTIAVRPDRVSPLHYYALRDPSAVKVRPVNRPQPDGERHVQLIFDFPRGAPTNPASTIAPETCAPSGPPAMWRVTPTGLPAFVLTIGLPIEREELFHLRVICAGISQNLSELCRTIMETGRAAG